MVKVGFISLPERCGQQLGRLYCSGSAAREELSEDGGKHFLRMLGAKINNFCIFLPNLLHIYGYV